MLRLGEFEWGATATGYIRVTNRGTGELTLDNFATTCSCAAIQVEQGGELRLAEVVNVPPGESIDLVAQVAVAGRVGTQQRVFARFRTNDPVSVDHAVEIVVDRIRGGVAAKPLAVSFGEMPRGAVVRRRVLLFDNGVSSRKVVRVVSSSPNRFAAALVVPTADENDHEVAGKLVGVIEVTASCQLPGSLDGHVEVFVAGEDRPPDRIDVTGIVRAPVECRPDTVVLPHTVAGATVYEAVTRITSRDGVPIRVACESAPEGFSVDVVADPGRADACTVRISGRPRHLADAGSTNTVSDVVMTVGMPEGAKERVTVRVLTAAGVR